MNLPFTETDLRRVAAHRSFERGLDYLGSVSGIDVRRERATATVYGSDALVLRLRDRWPTIGHSARPLRSAVTGLSSGNPRLRDFVLLAVSS
jgi:hypothetical protein